MVNQLSAAYAELVVVLMGALRPVADAKSDIDIANTLYDKSQTEINRLLAELAKQRESGQPNQDIVQALLKSFDFQQSQASQFANDRTTAWSRFNRASAQFQRALLTEIRDLGLRQIPVMVEIRRDLGLTGNLQEIEEFMREQWKKMEAHLNALLASLEDG